MIQEIPATSLDPKQFIDEQVRSIQKSRRPEYGHQRTVRRRGFLGRHNDRAQSSG